MLLRLLERRLRELDGLLLLLLLITDQASKVERSCVRHQGDLVQEVTGSFVQEELVNSGMLWGLR